MERFSEPFEAGTDVAVGFDWIGVTILTEVVVRFFAEVVVIGLSEVVRRGIVVRVFIEVVATGIVENVFIEVVVIKGIVESALMEVVANVVVVVLLTIGIGLGETTLIVERVNAKDGRRMREKKIANRESFPRKFSNLFAIFSMEGEKGLKILIIVFFTGFSGREEF